MIPYISEQEKKAHLESSEVDNAVNVRVGGKDFVEIGLVGDIDLGECWSLSTDQFNTVESLFGGIVEVIGDDNLIPSLEQCKSSERANVACATAM